MNKLGLYNEALLIVGERSLASLTEDREPRRLLDNAWDNDAVKRCLEAGLWQFATRTVMLGFDPTFTWTFGFLHRFNKPSDFVRTSAIATDEYFTQPLLQYTDEADSWFSDLETIYVKYISDNVAYGSDMSLWPGSFGRYVAAYLAAEISLKLSQDEKRLQIVYSVKKERLHDALAKDAMAEPTKFPPQGRWVRSRYGKQSHKDGGNTTGDLIG